jgi:hypothetical protein
MVDPQPMLVEFLVRHVRLPREFLLQIGINSSVYLLAVRGLIAPKDARLCLRVPIDITFDLRHTVSNGVTQSSGRRDLCSSRGAVVLDQPIRAG